MLSSSLDVLLKLSKTTFPKNIFDYDCETLYNVHCTLGCTKFFLYLGSNTPRFIKKNKKYFTQDEKFKKKLFTCALHFKI